MPAKPHRVRLYRRNSLARAVVDETIHLDPRSESRLREILVELATRQGGRRVDLTHWRITVETTGRLAQIVARVQVDDAGRTVIS